MDVFTQQLELHSFYIFFLFRGVHLDYAESDAAVCMTPTSWIILKF